MFQKMERLIVPYMEAGIIQQKDYLMTIFLDGIRDIIQIIGGNTQYRALDIAPDSKAKWSIIPHVIAVGSPRPRKLKTDSAYTAQVTIRTV